MTKKFILINVLIFLGALVGVVLWYQDQQNLNYRERVVSQHLQQNTSFLNLVPVAMFPESAQRYLIRSIDPKNPDFVVALVFPRIESIDHLGNITYDYTDKKVGVQLALVMIRNKQPNFYVTELLEGYSLNPFAFSNVGYYEKNTIRGNNPKQFELIKANKFYHFEIGDPNLTQIKSIDVDGILMKLKKPVAFDQLSLYLK